MDAVFVSEFLELDDEFEKMGVFDSIMNMDSAYFINLLRLKDAKTPEFQGAYDRINHFFDQIMILLDCSKQKNDKFFCSALKLFNFHGVKSINLGVSRSGVDLGFGPRLSSQVINDAYDIVKAGSKQPEIFHLVGLFEENISTDRLSDMIATIILPDIQAYTRRINMELNISSERYPKILFHEGIVVNPFKDCDLLYLPEEILHEIPIAKSWEDIDRVISENEAFKAEVNEAIGIEWAKMCSAAKKEYMRNHFFKDCIRCQRIIEKYKMATIEPFSKSNDWDYCIANAFKIMKKSGVFNFLEHSDQSEISSFEATIKILKILKDWIENNKGWEDILQFSTQKREKGVQRLLHLASKYFCEINNFDMSFEPNEGPGPVDAKVSRGNDKTVVEIKLSSNQDYLHGYEEQIESYAKAEGTDNRIFVYIQVGNQGRD